MNQEKKKISACSFQPYHLGFLLTVISYTCQYNNYIHLKYVIKTQFDFVKYFLSLSHPTTFSFPLSLSHSLSLSFSI